MTISLAAVILFDHELEALEGLCAIAASFLVLSASTWAIIRYGRKHLRAATLPIAALPFLVAIAALVSDYERNKPNTGPPVFLPSSSAGSLLSQGELGTDRVAYFDDDLFVGTNIGLLRFHANQLAGLYRFQRDNSVVSGPWLDLSDHRLWVIDEAAGDLLSYDGATWLRMKRPVPPPENAHGSALEGFRPSGNADGFWLADAGSAWKWNEPRKRWEPQTSNSVEDHDYKVRNEVVGAVPVGSLPLVVVRHEAIDGRVETGEGIASDDVAPAANLNKALPRAGSSFLAYSWAPTHDAAYICTKDEQLEQVTAASIQEIAAPGPCSMIIADSNGLLLALIKGSGIYRRTADARWELIASLPQDSGSSDLPWRFSESSAQIALTDGKHLWIADHGQFQPIPLR